MFHRTLLFAVVTILPVVAQDRPDPGVLRIVDLVPGAVRVVPGVAPPLPPLVRGPDDSQYDSEALLQQLRDPRPEVGADEVLLFARDRYGERWDEQLGSSEVRGNRVFLIGPAGLCDEAAKFLGWAAATRSRTVTVEVLVFDPRERHVPAQGVEPVMPDGDVSKLTGDLPPLWRARATVPIGTAVVFGPSRSVPIVSGVRVDLAQEVVASEAVVGSLFEGDRVAVSVEGLSSGDRFAVYSQYAHGALRQPMEERATGVPDQPRLDVPSLDVIQATMSGVVPGGGALWCWVGGDPAAGDGRIAVVKVTGSAQPDGGPSNGCAILPVGALVRTGLDRRATFVPHVRRGEPPLDITEIDDAGLKFDLGELQDLVRGALEAHRDQTGVDTDAVPLIVDALGDSIAIIGRDDDIAVARRIVAELERRYLTNVVVRSRTDRAGDSNPDAALHAFVAPQLVGRPWFAMRGIESRGVHHLSGNVAQKARGSSPEMQDLFSGVVCSILVRAPAAAPWVDADVDVQIEDPLRVRTLEGPISGDLSVPPVRRTHFTHAAPVVLGQRIEFGGATSPDGIGVVQSLEVR